MPRIRKNRHTQTSGALGEREKRERLSLEDKDGERKQRLPDRRERQETEGRSPLIALLRNFIMS